MATHHLQLDSKVSTPAAPDGTPIYRVVARGEVDIATAPQLKIAFDNAINDGALLVILDASQIEFLDSSGLRVIVNTSNRLSEEGGRLLIEGMSGVVQRVLEISGLIERYIVGRSLSN